ncbi:MAG TPA: hypothetical protein VLW52_02340 [Opitutaceae bacterium]|nr:hypothetical protein [Opitutaceae bacterium]
MRSSQQPTFSPDSAGRLGSGRSAPRGFPLPARDVAGMHGLLWITGLVALAPLLIWRQRFAELFWFADDLFLTDQIAQMGFWKWTGQFFAENFAPLFKLLWGGALFGFAGSYAAMLWLLWLTHALNTVLVGRLLLRAGFPWIAAIFTQLVFALTPANLETLGWSVQWSAVLAVTFLLLGLLWYERHAANARAWSWHAHVPLFLFASASACCFSRGVLTGGVLALAILAPIVSTREWASWHRRLPAVLLCLLPAVTVAASIMLFAGGNQQNMTGHWGEALKFSAAYLLLNPGYLLLGEAQPGSGFSLLLGLLKLVVIVLGLAVGRGRVRTLLALLLVYDVGNAVLLGAGRYHTGLLAALSSRYYYSSLLATLPFGGLLLAWVMERFVPRDRLRRRAAGVLLFCLALLCLRGWPASLVPFVAWRGTEMRRLMQAPYTSASNATVPALDFMHIERAKALQRAFHLH